MNAALRIVIAAAWVASLAACAADGYTPNAVATSMRPRASSVERAGSSVVAGRSTKADVLARLGETQAIRFDSGFEVWVYRLTDGPMEAPVPRSARSDKTWPWTPPELVILFDPSGVVAKTRIRPAPAL